MPLSFSNTDGGRTALKHMWYVVCGLTSIQGLIAIICAAFNHQTRNGYKSAAFAALWNMFMIAGFCRASYSIVFHNKSNELMVGLMIGMAYMLAQLFFVLMIVFFIFGTEAEINNAGVAPSDKAYGTFALFNMFAYFAWAILLTAHRKSLINSETSNKNVIEDGDQYAGEGGDASEHMDEAGEIDYNPGEDVM